MEISLGILFGILAMIGWGLSDFLAAYTVRKTEFMKSFFWTRFIGLLLYLCVFFLFFKIPTLTSTDILILLAAGVLTTIADLALYKSLQVGKIGIVSPIFNCWPLIVVILGTLFLGEILTNLQIFGVALIIVGGILASMKFHDLIRINFKNIAVGVEWALLAFLTFGLAFFLLGMSISNLSWFIPVFIVRTIVMFLVGGYTGIKKVNIKFPINIWIPIAGAGIIEALAFFAYGFGASLNYSSVIAPIISGVPMVTGILARIFFKERLETNQIIGVVTIIAGLIMLSL